VQWLGVYRSTSVTLPTSTKTMHKTMKLVLINERVCSSLDREKKWTAIGRSILDTHTHINTCTASIIIQLDRQTHEFDEGQKREFFVFLLACCTTQLYAGVEFNVVQNDYAGMDRGRKGETERKRDRQTERKKERVLIAALARKRTHQKWVCLCHQLRSFADLCRWSN
jgi:hypothetical protein